MTAEKSSRSASGRACGSCPNGRRAAHKRPVRPLANLLIHPSESRIGEYRFFPRSIGAGVGKIGRQTGAQNVLDRGFEVDRLRLHVNLIELLHQLVDQDDQKLALGVEVLVEPSDRHSCQPCDISNASSLVTFFSKEAHRGA